MILDALRVARSRIFGVLRKEELEDEIDEELRFHIAMRAQENIARGLSPREAAQQAQRQFGNINRIKDAWRDVSGGGALEAFAQDVRFAARMLMKDRAFTFVAVVALALGIGANTALFTVLSNVLLRPLPYAEPHRIMSVSLPDSSRPGEPFPVSYPDFVDLRAQNQVFEQMAAYRSGGFVVRIDDGDAAQVPGAVITTDMFPLLGVKPAIGRNFRQEEDEAGSRVVLISHDMWMERFGKAANITKAKLTIHGREFAIIGVMPPGFRFPVQNDPAQFWIAFGSELDPVPDALFAVHRRDAHFLGVLGRLKSGLERADAERDLQRVAADIAAKHPDLNRGRGSALVLPWLAEITRGVRPVLLMLIAAAGSVLCLACVNVANLLLARASTRRKEIALRAALGAGKGRILRQLLTESLLLAALGGLGGVLLAFAGTRYIVSALPSNFPRATEIAPDLRVLAFAGMATLLTSCLFGLAPGWRSARAKLAPLLNEGGHHAAETRGGRRARSVLVVAQMVLAFLLLAAACFFITNLLRLQTAPLGFNPAQLVTANFTAPSNSDAAGTSPFMEQLFGRIAGAGLGQSASAVSRLPMTGSAKTADIRIPGRSKPPAVRPIAEAHVVGSRYFETMQITMQEGRDFDERDSRDATPVVIVNETLAQRFFPGENAIGKRITPGLFVGPAGRVEREIVAVVHDVRTDMLATQQRPQFYIPWAQCPLVDLTLVVRSNSSRDAVVQAIGAIVGELDPDVAIHDSRTMNERIAGGVAAPRLNSALLAIFAGVAVALTAIGVHGVMVYSVAQRRHEIGIRLAMGAQHGDVFQLVLREGLRLIACSVVVGGICTAIARPLLQTFAYQGRSGDFAIIVLPALLLACVAFLASSLPARRAAALDPLDALGQR